MKYRPTRYTDATDEELGQGFAYHAREVARNNAAMNNFRFPRQPRQKPRYIDEEVIQGFAYHAKWVARNDANMNISDLTYKAQAAVSAQESYCEVAQISHTIACKMAVIVDQVSRERLALLNNSLVDPLPNFDLAWSIEELGLRILERAESIVNNIQWTLPLTSLDALAANQRKDLESLAARHRKVLWQLSWAQKKDLQRMAALIADDHNTKTQLFYSEGTSGVCAPFDLDERATRDLTKMINKQTGAIAKLIDSQSAELDRRGDSHKKSLLKLARAGERSRVFRVFLALRARDGELTAETALAVWQASDTRAALKVGEMVYREDPHLQTILVQSIIDTTYDANDRIAFCERVLQEELAKLDRQKAVLAAIEKSEGLLLKGLRGALNTYIKKVAEGQSQSVPVRWHAKSWLAQLEEVLSRFRLARDMTQRQALRRFLYNLCKSTPLLLITILLAVFAQDLGSFVAWPLEAVAQAWDYGYAILTKFFNWSLGLFIDRAQEGLAEAASSYEVEGQAEPKLQAKQVNK